MKLAALFKSNLFALSVLAVLIIAVFSPLAQTFYQQDEWNGLGLVFSQGLGSVFPGAFQLIDLFFVKGRIMSSLVFYAIAVNFPLQNMPFVILAIALHTIATFLVFLLTKKLVQNTFLSILGASFFAVNAVSHGAVTWPVIAINTIGSSILVLSSVLFFFKFLESSRKKLLLISGLVLYLSLWFKEIGLYLFLFFPLYAFVFKRGSLKDYLKNFWWFLTPFFLIVGYRLLELRLITEKADLYVTGNNDNFFLTLLLRAILYPITSFSLMFIPGGAFIEFAREVLRDNYIFFANAPNDVLIAQTVILDLLAVVASLGIFLLVILGLRKERTENRKTVFFWLMFTLLSFTPYVVLSKDFSYLESRYYYLAVVGGAVLFSWLLARAWAVFGKKLFLIFVFPIALAFVFWHAISVRSAIDEQVIFSNWRKSFMSELGNLAPTLTKDKNVIYITGNKNYWSDGNKVPFQQGTGYTLMVLYNSSGKIPKELLRKSYLFEIGSQGYKEVGSLGFGYFWDEEELEKTIKDNDLGKENIISLYYNSKENKLEANPRVQ